MSEQSGTPASSGSSSAPGRGSAGEDVARRKRLARIALLAVAASILVVVAAGGLVGLFLVVVGGLGMIVMLIGGYWFLAHHGVLRWAGIVLAVAAPIAVIWAYAARDVLLVAIIAVVLMVGAGLAARSALQGEATAIGMSTYRAPRPRRAFIVMNPHSGGGKVGQFDLKAKAEAFGAEVALMEGPGIVDVAALARDALERGADLLGVAGGDGTQALVAGVAADAGVPLLVISAGTRNHFALDLGLDRDDPASCLDALGDDGVELRTDLGMIAGRPFVNNASFGAYAEIVQSPEYRDNKEATALAMLPDLLSGNRGPHLTVTVGGTTVDGPQAVMVSNNPYESGRLADFGRRSRLDRGTLGVVAGKIGSAVSAVDLVRGTGGSAMTRMEGTVVTIESSAPTVAAGVDGEALQLSTPIECTIRPGALRVRVPHHRPGMITTRAKVDWRRLRDLAFG